MVKIGLGEVLCPEARKSRTRISRRIVGEASRETLSKPQTKEDVQIAIQENERVEGKRGKGSENSMWDSDRNGEAEDGEKLEA